MSEFIATRRRKKNERKCERQNAREMIQRRVDRAEEEERSERNRRSKSRKIELLAECLFRAGDRETTTKSREREREKEKEKEKEKEEGDPPPFSRRFSRPFCRRDFLCHVSVLTWFLCSNSLSTFVHFVSYPPLYHDLCSTCFGGFGFHFSPSLYRGAR